MAKTVPCFGQIYRANSCGFVWDGGYRLFIRIDADGPNRFRVEVRPPTYDFRSSIVGKSYVTIQHDMLYMSPALNTYQGRNQVTIFYVDDDGVEIKQNLSVPPEDLSKLKEVEPPSSEGL